MALFMLTIGTANASNFVTIKGENLMDANGKKLYIVGTNLGNWLNPEGYMFDFKKTNCEWMINDMVCELAGPTLPVSFGRHSRTITSPKPTSLTSSRREPTPSDCLSITNSSPVRITWEKMMRLKDSSRWTR